MTLEEMLEDIEQSMFKLSPHVENLYKMANMLKESIAIKKNDPYKPMPVLGYNSSTTVANKILFALIKLNRFSSHEDIEKKIKLNEVNFNKGLSTPLTLLRKSGVICVFKPSGSNRQAYYGFPIWMDGFGEPLPEFMYKNLDVKTLNRFIDK